MKNLSLHTILKGNNSINLTTWTNEAIIVNEPCSVSSYHSVASFFNSYSYIRFGVTYYGVWCDSKVLISQFLYKIVAA